MEDADENPFNSHALSFDSTLDSLLDGEFVPDDKTLPFEPSSDVLMSAPKCFRADIVQNGDGGASEELGMETIDTDEEFNIIDELPVTQNGIVHESDEDKVMESVSEISENASDIPDKVVNSSKPEKDLVSVSQISESASDLPDKVTSNKLTKDLESVSKTTDVSVMPEKVVNTSKSDNFSSKIIANTSSAGVRGPSPNFNKIKEKRKRNLANQRSNANSVNKISDDNKNEVVLKQSGTKNQDKDSEEPPHKRKRSKEPNKKPIDSNVPKPLESKCPFKSAKIGVNNIGESIGSHELKKSETSAHSAETNAIAVEDTSIKTSSEINTTFESSTSVSVDESNSSSMSIEVSGVGDGVNDAENEDTIDDSDANTTLVEDNDEIIENDKDNDENLNELTAESDNDEGSDDDGDDDSEDEYVDDDEIHGWLEEGVENPQKKRRSRPHLKDGEFMSWDKPVIEEKGVNHFEVLPTGWLMIIHDCGMPVYLHKPTRVCTFSRPYYIGESSSRRHDIPLSSIPCMQYRRELKKEEDRIKEAEIEETEQKAESNDKDKEIDLLQKATLKHAEDTNKMVSLEPADLYKYCQGLFQFKLVKVKRFNTWKEKRADMVEEKKKRDKQLPKLASDTKLITCPIPVNNNTSQKRSKKKEFVMNPEGKTAVCILHEYSQNVIRVQPTYEFKEVQNAECPYQATVLINGIQYGSGTATGKRQAKNEAAKATLNIFVPELRPYLEGSTKAKQKDELSADLQYFEEVAIDDPRVQALCNKASLPMPYQVLQTCLQRNFGLGDTTFKTEKKLVSNQKTEFTLTVGKRHCTVICKNKREAKQKAAQVMLKELHPDLKSWAAILRLYSKSSEVGYLERDEEGHTAADFRLEKKKNREILDKLKSAMRKVKEQRKHFSDGNSIPAQVPSQTLNL